MSITEEENPSLISITRWKSLTQAFMGPWKNARSMRNKSVNVKGARQSCLHITMGDIAHYIKVWHSMIKTAKKILIIIIAVLVEVSLLSGTGWWLGRRSAYQDIVSERCKLNSVSRDIECIVFIE